VDSLKQENEKLIKNQDSEIKRMSDFVDKYTSQMEAAKKQIRTECD